MRCALCSGLVSLYPPLPGPFMAVLFAKLENMLQNSVYVNFLLTGLVAQLACHPQPLLRSFLLNTNMVFQPSVKSLLQVCDACMHGCVQAPWWARPAAGVALGGLGTGPVGLERTVSLEPHKNVMKLCFIGAGFCEE